jgi:hypothetical protein
MKRRRELLRRVARVLFLDLPALGPRAAEGAGGLTRALGPAKMHRAVTSAIV